MATADFNSDDLSRKKARANRKASLPVQYVRLSAPKKDESSEAKDTLWATGSSRFEVRYMGPGDRRVQFDRIGSPERDKIDTRIAREQKQAVHFGSQTVSR